MQNETSGKRAILSLACALAATVCGTLMASTFKCILPAPIRSAEVEHLLRETHYPVAGRPALELALDAYVQDWQRLRDGTFRPMQAQFLRDEQIPPDSEWVPMALRGLSFPEMTEAQQAEYERASQAKFEQVSAGRFRRQRLKRDMFDEVRRIEARLLMALRSGLADQRGHDAIEAFDQARTRRLAIAALATVAGDESTLLTTSLPGPMEGLEPEEAEVIRARLMQLRRDSLPLLEEEGRLALGTETALHPHSPHGPASLKLYLQAIHDIESRLPGTAGRQWAVQARIQMIDYQAYTDPIVSRALVEHVVGDHMDAVSRARLDAWDAQRRPILDAVLTGLYDDGDVNPHLEALHTLDAALLKELATATDTPELADDFLVDRLGELAVNESHDPEEALLEQWGSMDAFSDRMRGRMGDDPASDEEIVRGLQRGHVDAIRRQLTIPEDQRDLWNTLADDALEACERVRQEMAATNEDAADAASDATDENTLRDAGRQLERIEDRWFESVATAFPEIPRDALRSIRSRRRLELLRGTSGVVRTWDMLAVHALLRVDLDALAEKIRPESRLRAHAHLEATRERLISMTRTLIDDGMEVTRRLRAMHETSDDGETSCGERCRRARRVVRFMRDCTQRITSDAQTLDDALDAIARSLPSPDADTFRRALREQRHPEIYRPISKAEEMIGRILAAPLLQPHQRHLLQEDIERFKNQSELLAHRAVSVVQRADELGEHRWFSAMISVSSCGCAPEWPTREMRTLDTDSMIEQRTEDTRYDLEEFVASGLRRMRSRLSAEQARAVGL